MLTSFRINTQTHSNVRHEEAARCSASCVDRSDRSLGAVRPVAAGRTVTKPTNVSPGRPVGASARTPSIDVETTEEQQIVDWKS